MRRSIPDKDVPDNAVWTDDELASFLADEGDWRRGAALALETMAADTAYTGALTQVGDVKVDGASVARALLQRAAALRDQAQALSPIDPLGGVVPTPYAGGLSRSDKDTREEDTDRVDPFFTRRLHEPIGSGHTPSQ